MTSGQPAGTAEKMTMGSNVTRRDFVAGTAAGLVLAGTPGFAAGQRRLRLAIVGTGIRGVSFWGEFLNSNYSDVVEFVALCDTNPGRLAYAKRSIGVNCPTFTDIDEMLDTVAIDTLIVTTVDATHHTLIVKGLERHLDVITEKPMTTDERQCQAVLDAARESRGRLLVGLNYRYGKIFTRLKERLTAGRIGRLTSIDFNWYLNVHHGASYFRRWHGIREHGGTLLVHKSAHHFDLLNWWIGADPVEVHAYGDLEHYGANNAFRGKRCMDCEHSGNCTYFWDMRGNQRMMNLYHAHEAHDGYIRDNCLWREAIDIFDKMAVQIRYANGVQVSYSLTTYSPYEGFRLGFNGTDGRMETWEGVPSLMAVQQDQATLHDKEMDQHGNRHAELEYHEIVTQRNFAPFDRERLPYVRAGHWGGDRLMADYLFRGQSEKPELGQQAGLRDGALSVLVGIAARRSIDEGRPVRIADLTNMELS